MDSADVSQSDLSLIFLNAQPSLGIDPVASGAGGVGFVEGREFHAVPPFRADPRRIRSIFFC
jgi:hypothetical protein